MTKHLKADHEMCLKALEKAIKLVNIKQSTPFSLKGGLQKFSQFNFSQNSCVGLHSWIQF